MPESEAYNTSPTKVISKTKPWSFFALLLTVLSPVIVATLVYQLDSFEPVPYPNHELTQPPLKALKRNGRMLQGSEFLGVGKLAGPEDIAYDSKSGILYTTCANGWVKRVRVNESAISDWLVDNWVNTGGRPLGLVLGNNHEVIVADAYKGILKIRGDGEVELLTDEAEGLKFKFADGLDIADDGTIYFTDASSKYYLHDFIWDILEGKPNGRLMSYDQVTKETKVLARDLHFANGVALSPDQDHVIFCETPMRRCRRYHIRGAKKGLLEKFIDHLPGLPDNIHYDGHGCYYIALATETAGAWELALKHPFLRKLTGIVNKYIATVYMAKNSGVFIVDLKGKPTEHYHDPGLAMLSSAVKIGNHIYCGSISNPYIVRFDLAKHPAEATA